jgi:hypothetical protein
MTVREWLRAELAADAEAMQDKRVRDWLGDGVETLLALGLWYRIVSHVILFRVLAGREADMHVRYRLTSGPQATFLNGGLTARQDFELRLYSAGWWAICGLGFLTSGMGPGGEASSVFVVLLALNWGLLVADPLIWVGHHAAQVREDGSSPSAAGLEHGD